MKKMTGYALATVAWFVGLILGVMLPPPLGSPPQLRDGEYEVLMAREMFNPKTSEPEYWLVVTPIRREGADPEIFFYSGYYYLHSIPRSAMAGIVTVDDLRSDLPEMRIRVSYDANPVVARTDKSLPGR
ncbi:MAG: hypothetical protein AAB686_01605 [Patescibacteria group bacterium]